ncbi:MAG: isoaspartyl peptidase/L-asparaginase [Blastocatellia bacterium]|nr:isoaspartyl peptidase/L-asparaginase [Blastocatellia bacterium]
MATIAIHGGAGTILRSAMTRELEADYRDGLTAALNAGWEILERGGPSLDAVEAAVISLENFPLFNSGRGSVFTTEGKNEMDAAIMDGSRLRAGAVAFVQNVVNPIKLARLVMEQTEHVLLAGTGANQFAAQQGVEMADDAYFFTQHRYDQLLEARDRGVVQLDHTVDEADLITEADERPKGTVGAVACDNAGRLAAATSTGGMTNKKFGRIGDTPIIGSGTYADDVCAVSCTGHGEYFMLGATAYDVSARMKYQNLTLEQAAAGTIARLTEIGGEGGLIAVDGRGNVTLPFNSDGMYRASVTADGEFIIDIYA